MKQAVQLAPAKLAPQCPSIKIEEVYDKNDHHTSVPPRNPRHILEVSDGSDDDTEEDMKKIDEPEESNKAELSTLHCSVLRPN